MIELSTLLICFCSFELFCPLLDKDISIENLYIVSSCPIRVLFKPCLFCLRQLFDCIIILYNQLKTENQFQISLL